MAKAARIDDVILHPDGRVEVRYTEGTVPLPAAWGGVAEVFANKSDFAGSLATAEDTLAPVLRSIQLGKAYKTDPAITSTFVTAVKGKQTSVDLTGQVDTVKVG